jgi:SAM-dependent methyltransferase
MAPHVAELFGNASDPYRSSGRYAWHFARGKLRHDPYFLSVIEGGWLPREGRLIDLGCGQGLLLALLCAARQLHASGSWPAAWPAPPDRLVMSGIERDAARVDIARRALGQPDPTVEVHCGDVQTAPFPRCSAITLMDVLLYLEHEAQERVLEKAAHALAPHGVLILREADTTSGARFAATRWSAWMASFLQGGLGARRHYRSSRDWQSVLERLGFTVEVTPMSRGMPFSNMLFVGRLR